MSVDARITIGTLPEPAVLARLNGLQEVFTYLCSKHREHSVMQSTWPRQPRMTASSYQQKQGCMHGTSVSLSVDTCDQNVETQLVLVAGLQL